MCLKMFKPIRLKILNRADVGKIIDSLVVNIEKDDRKKLCQTAEKHFRHYGAVTEKNKLYMQLARRGKYRQ